MLQLAPDLAGVRDDLVFDLIAQVGHNSSYLQDQVTPIEQTVPIADHLATRHPDDVTYAYRHAWIHIVLAQRLDAAGRRPESPAPASQGIDLLFRLCPAIESSRDDLVFDLVALVGQSCGYLARAEAVIAVQRAVEIAERLVARHPGDVTYAERLAWISQVQRDVG